LAEFNRVLKPQGVIHVAVKKQPGDKKTELEKLLIEAGFTIEDITDTYVDRGGRSEVTWVVALARKK